MQGTFSKAVNVGNKIGKGIAIFRFASVTVVCIIVFVIGYHLRNKKLKYTGKADGKINKADCESYTATEQNGNSIKTFSKYRCDNVGYTFTVDEKEYKNNFSSDSRTNYIKGQTVPIEYVPTNPSDNRRKQQDIRFIGKMMMIGSLVVFLLSLIFLVVILKVKGAGSMYTVQTAINTMKPNRRNNPTIIQQLPVQRFLQ